MSEKTKRDNNYVWPEVLKKGDQCFLWNHGHPNTMDKHSHVFKGLKVVDGAKVPEFSINATETCTFAYDQYALMCDLKYIADTTSLRVGDFVYPKSLDGTDNADQDYKEDEIHDRHGYKVIKIYDNETFDVQGFYGVEFTINFDDEEFAIWVPLKQAATNLTDSEVKELYSMFG